MRAVSRRLNRLWGEIDAFMGAPATTPAPSVSGTAASPALGDKVTDVGATPGKSRLERYWGDLRPKVGTLLGRAASEQPPAWSIDVDAAKERFGLRAVEFGNWENQQERLNWFYASAMSFEELAQVLRVDPDQVGFGGRLSLALGARGAGFLTGEAHYEVLPYAVINLTKTRGQHALGHEWAHAWDNVVARSMKLGRMYVSGTGLDLWSGPSPERMKAGGILQQIETLFESLLGAPDRPTALWRRIASEKPYFRRRVEIWARIVETFLAYRLRQMGITNTFLVESLGWYGGEFPTATEIRPVLHLIEKIFKEGFKTIAAGAPADARAPRVELRDGILYGARTSLVTASRTLEAWYAITELDDLIVSHDPRTFKPNPSYPPGCQQRDYHYDKSEQAAARSYAKSFHAAFLLTDTPSAIDGPPVVSEHRVVLGGNKRTMVLANLDDYQVYVEELKRRLSPFYGITAEHLKTFRRPVLIRVIKVPMTECALYSNLLNKGLTQGMSLVTSTVSYARQLAAADVATIARILEEADADTPAQALTRPKVVRELVHIFQRSEIITDRNRSEWLDADGLLTEQGRLMFERTLLGAILPDRALIETARSYTQQILKILPLLVRGRALPSGWDPMPWISEAIRLESRRRSAGIEKASFRRQTGAFDQEETPAEVRIMWDALDLGPKKFRGFIEGYVQQAEREARAADAGGGFGFTTPMTPLQVLAAVGKKLGIECASCGSSSTSSQAGGSSTLSDQVSPRTAQLLRLPTKLQKFVGKLPEGFIMLVWGPAGAGKSTLATWLASMFGAIGPVLWVLGEDQQRFGRLKERAERLRVQLKGVSVLEPKVRGYVLFSDIEREVAAGGFRFLVVDSKDTVYTKAWTEKASIYDWHGLADRHPELSIVLISHADTAGRIPIGGSAWRHHCSIEIYVDRDRKANVIKNWDGPKSIMKLP